jgi:hypothetical protein
LLAAILALALCCTGKAIGDDKWTFGTEFDLLPFLNHGYYVSAIVGKGRLRGRLVRTELTIPGFATDDAFEDNKLAIWGAVVDVFFKDGFSGWWVGSGFERWNGDVTEKASDVRESYQTNMFTLGGGYAWKFSKHFYLNPWAGVHIPISGDQSVTFPSSTLEIKTTPEASVKLGIEF